MWHKVIRKAMYTFFSFFFPVGKLFSAFDPPLVIKEQWATVTRPGSNWGFRVLLKDILGRAGVEPGTR